MSDKTQLITRIRFALEQLSERNAEHEWEHLCRHFASERICSNILPATGPVQSGGDQGRDFETFHTFLSNGQLGKRSFVGLLSDKPLAFACTLEKEKSLPSKVRDDVRTIMSSGTSVEGIYVFCSRAMNVSKRHKLQKWARETYGVQLEVFDGGAMAELLCDRDVFWLAERYLQLPAELAPPLPTGEEKKDWYTSTLEKWRRQTQPAQTYAHFSEIRAAARIARGPFSLDDTSHSLNRYELPEFPYWIERLEELASQGAVESLRRRAFYEIIVLRLRGLGSLVGQEARLRMYFSDIPHLLEASDLGDAQVLLGYVFAECRMGRVALGDSEVLTWLTALERRLDDRLRAAKKNTLINECCALYGVLGFAALTRSLSEGTLDASQALRHWNKLAKLVTRAPLFPLESFADSLTQSAAFIGTHPEYESLTKRMDALLAERFGHFKAADKCVDRAMAFHKLGDLPRAMAQLHRAKIDWFAEETLGKSLLALNALCGFYLEQGLCFAAKYYGLAGAYVALRAQDLKLKVFVARSLERAASCDYTLGAWNGFLDLAEIFAIVYPHYAHDPDADFNKSDGVLHYLSFHLLILATATKLVHPNLATLAEDRVQRIMERLGLADILEQTRGDAERAWNARPESFWEAAQDQLNGPPWSDAGPQRQAQWKAHGITWQATWSNDYETTLAAEEFLAALQILLSDLAGQDLCLLRSTLGISLRLSAEDMAAVAERKNCKGFDVDFEPSNTERVALVTLPPYRLFRDGVLTREDLWIGALGLARCLLTEVSLLPLRSFDRILKERLKEGLRTKLLVGPPYGRCLSEFVSQDDFDAIGRSKQVPLSAPAPFESRLPERLPWFDGPGPGYDSQQAAVFIRNRYDKFIPPIRHTLQRLKRELPFRIVVSRLRDTGWKDWHILSAVFHVTMNYRLDRIRRTLGSEAHMVASRRIPFELETENAPPVPLEEYSETNLRDQFRMFVIAFAKTYKLELHQPTPVFSAIEDFVAKRYNFWKDDVEHDDPFKL